MFVHVPWVPIACREKWLALSVAHTFMFSLDVPVPRMLLTLTVLCLFFVLGKFDLLV